MKKAPKFDKKRLQQIREYKSPIGSQPWKNLSDAEISEDIMRVAPGSEEKSEVPDVNALEERRTMMLEALTGKKKKGK